MPQRRTWLLRTRASVSLAACAAGASSALATSDAYGRDDRGLQRDAPWAMAKDGNSTRSGVPGAQSLNFCHKNYTLPRT